MNYAQDDMKITGYKVLHPAIDLWATIKGISAVLAVVLVLKWAWVTSYADHAFAVVVGALIVLGGIYHFNKI